MVAKTSDTKDVLVEDEADRVFDLLERALSPDADRQAPRRRPTTRRP
jgi:hypothetical protein